MNALPALPATMRFIERDWLSANGVWFDDGIRTALVDTGHVKHRDLTATMVRRLLGERTLDLVVNTHLHSDHCGGNAILQHAFRPRTLIPAASADAVRDWRDDALSFEATRQRCERFTFDGTIEHGDTIELGGLAWRALAAPGHDPDSLVLHCAAEGLLISADALWADGFGVIFPELDGESGFAEQRAILEVIGSLDVAVVMPGHGPMFTDVAGALERARGRLDWLQADPARNARNAIKVFAKFMLLDRESAPRHAFAAAIAATPLNRDANARFLGMRADALGEWAIDALVRAGAARIDGDRVVNV